MPIEILFHNVDRSAAVENDIRERVGKLERLADDMVSCRVTVEAPHKHHRQGKLYHVAVDIRIPGGEIVASRAPGADHSHEDVHVAVRDAFNAARRQLQDRIRARRGDVKSHSQEVQPHGTVTALHPEQDYGWITTADGREIYFHRNSVTNADFGTLEPGIEVRFNEESTDSGPKASMVHVIGKL
jgi:cold shock CspA family protein/ribosome-associated translation inhibitor RaiA